MVFSSLIFLYLFLPLNLVLYYSFGGLRYRNALLTIFSLFFYAWGEPVYVFLLMITAFIDYYNGLIIEKNHGKWQAKAALIVSVSINLFFLGLFKYSDFFIENINLLAGTHFGKVSLIMPIGISFYTFQTISYTLDVYRRQVAAQKSYPDFLLFVSLYHQLVAGPIVRYADIANEIEHRVTHINEISSGIFRFCIGLFKKVAIANIAAELGSPYLDGNLANLTLAEAWFGIIMFSIQIYFDFSGYSDMALGLGKMFGFTYLENFNSPYAARSATDFWRRWHISLGSFFKDYVYIPLGGNRKYYFRNIFVVWFLTGFWHGASWNFIIWGLFFGCLIALEKLFLLRWLNKVGPLAHIYALLIVVFGWVLFYFPNWDRLLKYIQLLFANSNQSLYTSDLLNKVTSYSDWMAFVILACLPVFDPANPNGKKFIKTFIPWPPLRIAIALGMLVVSTVLLVGKSYNPFIYFRF